MNGRGVVALLVSSALIAGALVYATLTISGQMSDNRDLVSYRTCLDVAEAETDSTADRTLAIVKCDKP